MNRPALMLLGGVVVAVLVSPTFSATLRIPSQYSTIQAAINAAAAGDTILLASGPYTGVGNRDVDFLGTPVVLTSEEGRDSTIIDCEYLTRAFDIHSSVAMTTVISGIEIRNGVAYNEFGQGIRIVGANVRIEDSTIRSCGQGLGSGGGVSMTNSSVEIIRSTLKSNIAPDGSGGNIFCANSTLQIDSCEVVNGFVLQEGAGIYAGGGSISRITNTLFEYNGTGNGCCGGAISNYGQLRSWNCRLRDARMTGKRQPKKGDMRGTERRPQEHPEGSETGSGAVRNLGLRAGSQVDTGKMVLVK